MVEVGSEHRGEHQRDQRRDLPDDRAEPQPSTADRLHEVVTRLFGQPVPLRLRAWDGSESGPSDAQSITVRSRRALRRLLWRPDELGLARAYIAGELAIEGSLVGLLEQLAGFGRSEAVRPEAADRRELLRTAVLLGAVGPQPKRPDEESGGPLPTLDPDVAAAMFGERRVASPGVWSAGSDLPAAEEAGLATLADRLGLQPGMRVLDIGAGWGAFLARAGERYGIEGRGVTTTDAQAATAN
ncbi:MAG TPA: class I SAM-dependent methyltransferase, partial [Actinopolymorphaceae bacterium]